MGQAQRASELSYDAIQQYAERIGTKYKIYDADGRANLKDLVKTLGGQIEYVDTDESLFVADEGKFTIFLPNHTSQRRDQFTLAHELGHYFLHYLQLGETGEMAFQRGGQNRLETKANFFAASLLMPKESFKNQYERFGSNFFHIAQVFDVSPAAAEIRAEVLRLT